MRYFVEVIKDAITDEQAAATRLAETLKLDPGKALALLRRNPVTKPVTQAEAEKVAKLFRKAGIEVFVRSETSEAPEVKVSSPGWPETAKASTDLTFSSPTLPEVKVSSSNWSEPKIPENVDVAFSNPTLPEVKVSSPTWPVPKFSSPDLPDVKVSSSTWPDVKLSGPNLPEVKTSSPSLPDFKTSDLGTPGEDSLKLPASFFSGSSGSSEESPTIPFESKYPTLPPVSEAPIANETRAGSSVRQFLLASLLPGLLAIAGIATALYLLALPFMKQQQSTALQNATSTLASSVSGMINAPLDDIDLRQQLQAAINRTQPTLEENKISFVLLTDTEGNQVAGWYQGLPTPGVPDNFINPVLPEITRTLSEATTPNLPTQQQLIIDNQLTNVASQAVRQQDTPVGVISMGMQEKILFDYIRQPSMITLVAGLIPLILSSLLLSLILGRKQS